MHMIYAGSPGISCISMAQEQVLGLLSDHDDVLLPVPCILRPFLQPQNLGLKLEVVLKWKDIHVGNRRIVSVVSKWRGLKSHEALCMTWQDILTAKNTFSYGNTL